MTEEDQPEGILGMEIRQQSLEKEVSVLKDTVWRLTGRVFVLESFLSEKFDELVVDFGLKLSLSSGGHANFLAQAMSAEATVVKLGAGMSGNNHHHHNHHSHHGGESEEMSIHDLDAEHDIDGDDDPSPSSVGANITIDEHHQHHNGKHNNHGQAGHHHPSRENRHAHNRFLYKRDATEMDGGRNSSTTTHTEEDVHHGHEDDQFHGHSSQSDFNVEEFVVFPHVPEFILGQEVQNGSALMGSSANSEDSNNSDGGGHHLGDQMSSPDPHPHASSSNFARRNARYKCTLCSKLFTSEWHLKAHLVKHSDSSGVMMGSTNNNSLQTSSQQGSPTGHDSTSSNVSMSDDKPFACAYCQKRFKKRQELTVHLRTHTGEKPFRCPVCDRSFSQSSSMKTHLRIHTGEKPFRCRLCKSCFTVMHNYKKHLQTAHQIDDFS